MQEVSDVVSSSPELLPFAKGKEQLNYLDEAIKDDIEELKLPKDEDARVGHKTADTAFLNIRSILHE